MTTNANLPAMPNSVWNRGGTALLIENIGGLTKKELFCLHHGVEETGDPELDEIIRKGNHQKAAMAAMQGLLSRVGQGHCWVALESTKYADAMLAELEK